MLTDSERKRFAEYLLDDARSNRMIAEQLAESVPVLAVKKTELADAEILVAKELLAAETFHV